jgi:hypothetical protein
MIETITQRVPGFCDTPPGSALRSLPSVALSSDPDKTILPQDRRNSPEDARFQAAIGSTGSAGRLIQTIGCRRATSGRRLPNRSGCAAKAVSKVA